MTPSTLAILAIVQAAVRAAPDIARLVADTKTFIESLVSAGAIPVEDQNAVYDYLDRLADDIEAGYWPDHWKVQPDPQ